MLYYPAMSNTAIRVEVPDKVLSVLESRGKPEKEALKIVTRFIGVTDQKPIILSDDERREIESLIGRNISTGAEIITALKRLAQIEVGGVAITLNKAQMERLVFLAQGKEGDERKEWMKRRVMESLQRFMGLVK